MKLKEKNVSTIIIYNPKMGEHESRTSRIRRSRKRPLGEAASSPSSMLDREKRQRRCGCAGAATHIFSSAGGQKIRAQQHRPSEAPPKLERGGEHRRAPAQRPFSLFQPSLSDRFFHSRPPAGTRARRAVGPVDSGGNLCSGKPTSGAPPGLL